MTRWVCRWKPLLVPRGDTFQKAYLEEWEQEEDDQSYIWGEESKNNHRSRSVSRTTASDSLQTVQHDGWSATREPPALRGCPSLPQSSWQPFGDTNVPTKLWKRTETQESAFSGQLWGTPVPSKTMFANLFIQYSLTSFPSDYLFHILTRKSYLATRKTSRPYETGFSAWVKSDPETILKRHLVDAKGANAAFLEVPVRKQTFSVRRRIHLRR